MPHIVVTGDVTIDWNLAYHRPEGANPEIHWTARDEGCLNKQLGGAALLYALIQRINSATTLSSSSTTLLQDSPDYDRYHHSFALWDKDPRDAAYYRDHNRWGQSAQTSYTDSNGKLWPRNHATRRVWRIKHFLGFHQAAETCTWERMVCEWLPSKGAADKDCTDSVALIVCDDAGYFLRTPPVDDSTTQDVLVSSGIGALLSNGQHLRPWILFKLSGDIATLPAWQCIPDEQKQYTIVLVNIKDLRATAGVKITRGLSWERTVEDIQRELTHNPHLEKLQKYRYTIVSLNTSGAVLMERDKRLTLFYDPRFLEGDWEMPEWGRMMGYTTVMTASLVNQLMRHFTAKVATTHSAPHNTDCHHDALYDPVADGISAGIAAMRELYKSGYRCQCRMCSNSDGYFYQDADTIKAAGTNDHAPALIFPIEDVARYLESYTTGIQRYISIKDMELRSHEGLPSTQPDSICASSSKSQHVWSILDDELQNNAPLDTAVRVAKFGLGSHTEPGDAIGIPSLEIGKLQTVDRSEIETLRGIERQIREYALSTAPSRQPLNMAVFGPPGSGKSFAVEQVARSLTRIEMRTFNISQFTDVNELDGALHQVRDIGLSGVLPVIFWDEFDTTLENSQLGWLRYFLSPMQDGQFFERGITHTIGRCIFVFAGGINATMDELLKKIKTDHDAKVNDFISRLHGYINVCGIAPQDTADKRYLIRRAILLRSLLYEHAPQLFPEAQETHVPRHDTKGPLEIDTGLLKALLQTTYRHDTRSLKAIIGGSYVAGKRRFERSDLPAKTLLEIHIKDTSQFDGLLSNAT